MAIIQQFSKKMMFGRWTIIAPQRKRMRNTRFSIFILFSIHLSPGLALGWPLQKRGGFQGKEILSLIEEVPPRK